MANDQDAKIDAIIASLTGEGGMFAVQPIMHNGREYPMISTAPPQLAACGPIIWKVGMCYITCYIPPWLYNTWPYVI